ncbi:hypothetical protein JL720_5646 [Aureococcus anophagefferens]|nr:hypothetical protein JL720_5646 [Aureococcus anophagefferens]
MPEPSRPQFVAGGEHTLAVARDGACYSSGACGWAGRGCATSCRRSSAGAERPWTSPSRRPAAATTTRSPSARPERCVGCGVFCDGGNDGVIPALGRPDASAETIHPTAVDGAGPVAAVAAGAYHTVALTKDGRVVTFGAAQLGQLGRSPDGGGVDKAGLPVDARPRPVEGLDEAPLGIAAGANHSLALLGDGSAYGWGSNEFGQLGDESENAAAPRRIPAPPGCTYAAVSAGYAHSVLTDDRGRAWAFGRGDNGQLALGHDDDVASPSLCNSCLRSWWATLHPRALGATKRGGVGAIEDTVGPGVRDAL